MTRHDHILTIGFAVAVLISDIAIVACGGDRPHDRVFKHVKVVGCWEQDEPHTVTIMSPQGDLSVFQWVGSRRAAPACSSWAYSDYWDIGVAGESDEFQWARASKVTDGTSQ